MAIVFSIETKPKDIIAPFFLSSSIWDLERPKEEREREAGRFKQVTSAT